MENLNEFKHQPKKFPYAMAMFAGISVVLLDVSCNLLGLALIWKYILEIWQGGS